VSATTTFTAIGTGTDSLGNAVTYPDYVGEQDAVTVEAMGGQGCTPGYWKNNADKHDASAWGPTGYDPDDEFYDVFGVHITVGAGGKKTITDPTLLEALQATGGGVNALARHGVAALLNAAHPDIAYGIGDPQDVIDMVYDALISGDPGAIQTAHELLAGYNEAGCSLDMHGDPITINGY
jgi:hypothetical protein